METCGNICFLSTVLTRKEWHSQWVRGQGRGHPATLRAVLHSTMLSHTSDYHPGGKTPVYNYLSLEPVCWFVLVKLVSLVLIYILGDWNEHGLREVCTLFYSELYQKMPTVLRNCFTDWDVAPTSDSICSCGFSQGSQTWVKHLMTSWYLLGKSYLSICH